MESFFLIIKDGEFEPEHKQEKKKKEKSLIEQSIYNYLYYAKQLKKEISVRCIGFDPPQSYEKNLSDLYKCVNGNGDSSVIQVKYFDESETCKYFNTIKIESIFGFFDELDKTFIEKKKDKKEYLKYIIRNEMSKKFFESVVSNYTHAAKEDFVNSDVGLLKIWCDNYKMISDIVIDFAKIKIMLNDLIKSINDKYDSSVYSAIKGEYLHIKKAIERTKELIDKVNEPNPKQAPKQLVLDELSKNLFYLFQFISKQHSHKNNY